RTSSLYAMQKDFLKDLNKDQREAVLWTEGPIIILAGAGSGKTRVLTYRVLYLMEEKKVPGENILMVTFTNKAAAEMKERIKTHLGNASSQPVVATFHSLCAKILRIEGKHIGLSSKFAIYDEQDQQDAIKEALKHLSLSTKDFKPRSVLSTISQAKNQLISESDYRSFARGYFQETVAKIYPLYQKILKENDAVDFDDLMNKVITLFRQNPDILEKYQDRFHYILVDEYQDTNHAQYSLAKVLSLKWKNICVVGDFSQSIYSWRGADFTNLSKFKDDFKNSKTFSLSQNYRSTQKILDAAHGVISRNTTHPILSLWTENSGGEDITVYEARNEQDEAKFIISQIVNPISHNKYNYNDVAILYRTNAQSRVLEEVLLHFGIPYILIGGTRFYERKEVKDILSYLRVLANPKDMVSYQRIKKLGKGRLEKFEKFKEELEGKEKDTIDLLDSVIEKTGYLTLFDEDDEEDRGRLENIKELRSVAIEFPEISNFLENVALVEQEYMPDRQKNGDRKNAITLMTLHAAKGLEFPIVFMVGMEEGLFPHSRAQMDRTELEEERRLCYVGVTRAKEKLFLTYARQRLFFGQRTSNTVSRFILDLPEHITERNFSGSLDSSDTYEKY
ncbi:MAG: UvrD-helicase domain-containing protein, partial [Candidatus Levyibacteriota bacterium]